MVKYLCFVNLAKIVEADSKEEACEKFMDNSDMEDLYPDCKRYNKSSKIKIKINKVILK